MYVDVIASYHFQTRKDSFLNVIFILFLRIKLTQFALKNRDSLLKELSLFWAGEKLQKV